MVHLYCFIRDCGEVRPDAKVFKVKVGSSQRDQVKCSLLENYARDLGWYFHRWDDTTDKMLILRYGRFFAGSEKIGLRYETIVLSVSDLYRHIIDGDLDSVQNSPQFFRNLFRSYSIVNPTLHLRKSTAKIKTFASTFSRKNLSPVMSRQTIDTLYCGFAVFVLFILGAMLDGLAVRCGY